MISRVDLLILGGSGPIGQALERAAAHDRMNLIAASRRGPVVLDVMDSAGVDALLSSARPRTVVYLVNAASDSPERAVERLATVATASSRQGVERFLFSSSAAVYGDQGAHRYTEEDAQRGGSEYAHTKIQSEDALAQISTHGMSTLSLRIFNVFGPGCDSSLINRLAYGPPPGLRLTADFVRDYVHVDDVARAFLQAASHSTVTGAVNIGRGVGVSNIDLAAAAGDGAFEVTSSVGARSYSVADPARALDQLGWAAIVDPLSSLRTRIGL